MTETQAKVIEAAKAWNHAHLAATSATQTHFAIREVCGSHSVECASVAKHCATAVAEYFKASLCLREAIAALEATDAKPA